MKINVFRGGVGTILKAIGVAAVVQYLDKLVAAVIGVHRSSMVPKVVAPLLVCPFRFKVRMFPFLS